MDRVESFVDMLPVIGVAIGIIVLFVLLSSLVRRSKWPFERLTDNQLLRSVARNLAATTTLVAGVVLALEILDATKFVGALLGAAGVLGLAIGFAFKDIVENYLASVLLAIRRPFNVRDAVDIDGHVGKVMSLNTRATILMTFDGNHVRLPNARVFKAVVINFTRNPRRRFSFKLGAGTNEDLTAAQKLGLKTLSAMEGVMDDPGPFSVVSNLGDSTVTLEFRGWVDQKNFDFERVRGEAIRRVKIAFERASIEMPEPIYRVKMMGEGTDDTTKKEPPTDEGLHLAADDQIDHQMDEDNDTEEGENLLEAG